MPVEPQPLSEDISKQDQWHHPSEVYPDDWEGWEELKPVEEEK